MSQVPPFDGGLDRPGAPLDPTNPYAGDPPVKKGRGPLFWILLILGILGLLVLLCCGGLTGISYLGMSALNAEVVRQLNEKPAVREQFGEVESASLNFGATAQYGQENPEQGGNRMVYDIVGTNGSGQVRIRDLPGTPELDYVEVLDASGNLIRTDDDPGTDTSDAVGIDADFDPAPTPSGEPEFIPPDF